MDEKQTCKVCKVPKKRIYSYYTQSKTHINKRYIDGEGKIWNGLKCYDCHYLKIKRDRMKNKQLHGVNNDSKSIRKSNDNQ